MRVLSGQCCGCYGRPYLTTNLCRALSRVFAVKIGCRSRSFHPAARWAACSDPSGTLNLTSLGSSDENRPLHTLQNCTENGASRLLVKSLSCTMSEYARQFGGCAVNVDVCYKPKR